MRERYSRGATARIFFDIIEDGEGVISQTPTVAIQRTADSAWFQVSDGTWQVDIVQNDMTQTDPVNLPGRYHFDFDQALDDEEDSREYIVRKTNASGTLALAYSDLLFGTIPAVSSPRMCSVLGTLFTGTGDPLRGSMVRATLQPVFTDNLGRAVEADRVVLTFTSTDGDFDLELVRGGIFRLEIPAVGYDRKITVPDEDQVTFTDL